MSVNGAVGVPPKSAMFFRINNFPPNSTWQPPLNKMKKTNFFWTESKIRELIIISSTVTIAIKMKMGRCSRSVSSRCADIGPESQGSLDSHYRHHRHPHCHHHDHDHNHHHQWCLAVRSTWDVNCFNRSLSFLFPPLSWIICSSAPASITSIKSWRNQNWMRLLHS